MNIVKLYKQNPDGTVEVKRVRVTQSNKHKWHRTVPYVWEVERWARRNGWSRKRPSKTT